jgi:hypothetical protein
MYQKVLMLQSQKELKAQLHHHQFFQILTKQELLEEQFQLQLLQQRDLMRLALACYQKLLILQQRVVLEQLIHQRDRERHQLEQLVRLSDQLKLHDVKTSLLSYAQKISLHSS